MQRGSLAIVSRKEEPDVWQFRWSEKSMYGVRVQRKRVIGTIERYPNETSARSAVTHSPRFHSRPATLPRLRSVPSPFRLVSSRCRSSEGRNKPETAEREKQSN